MKQIQTEKFNSFDEFEREFMPDRYAAHSIETPWSIDRLTSDIASEFLNEIRTAVERGLKK